MIIEYSMSKEWYACIIFYCNIDNLIKCSQCSVWYSTQGNQIIHWYKYVQYLQKISIVSKWVYILYKCEKFLTSAPFHQENQSILNFPSCIFLDLGCWAIQDIHRKQILDSNLMRSSLSIAYISFVQSIWHFADSMSVALCFAQNFKMTG